MGFEIIKGENVEVKSVVVLLYGEPCLGKSSLALSSSKPILFDFDGGIQRCEFRSRKKCVRVTNWNIITDMYPTLEKKLQDYDTIVIDTVDSCLSQIKMSIMSDKKNYKIAKDNRAVYGKMKDEFETFLYLLLSYEKNVIFLAHETQIDKVGSEKIVPDITGKSRGLIVKRADFLGYMRMLNGERTIDFNPGDFFEAKCTGEFPLIVLPNFKKDFVAMDTFFANQLTRMKNSLLMITEDQNAALEIVDKLNKDLSEAKTVDDYHKLMKDLASVKDSLKKQLWEKIKAHAEKAGFTFDKAVKKFTVMNTAPPPSDSPAPEPVKVDEPKPEPPVPASLQMKIEEPKPEPIDIKDVPGVNLLEPISNGVPADDEPSYDDETEPAVENFDFN